MKKEIGIILGHASAGKTTLSDRLVDSVGHQQPSNEVIVIEDGTLKDFSNKQLKGIEVEVVKLQSNAYDFPMSGKERRRNRRASNRKTGNKK